MSFKVMYTSSRILYNQPLSRVQSYICNFNPRFLGLGLPLLYYDMYLTANILQNESGGQSQGNLGIFHNHIP